MPVYNLGKIAIVWRTIAEVALLQSTAPDPRTRPAADTKQLVVTAFPADLCLSYINTLSWRGRPEPVETLNSPVNLVDWIDRSEVLDNALVEETRRWIGDHKTEAAMWFAGAIAAREALFRIFSTIADDAPADPADIERFNAALAGVPRRDRVIASPKGLAWSLSAKKAAFGAVLAPVLWSAGDLLVSASTHRIRRCANEDCLWLFVDQSKTNNRRWCDMRSCGNRAKARRHYAKTKLPP